MPLLAGKQIHRETNVAVPGLPIDWIPITWLPIVLALLLITVFANSAKPAQSGDTAHSGSDAQQSGDDHDHVIDEG